MQMIYAADPTVWDGELGARIRHELDAGRIVVTRSASSAVMAIANISSSGNVETIAIRHNAHNRFATDGMPLLIGRVEATSFGLWTPGGYRSARLVTVHALDSPDDAGDTRAPWEERLRQLAACDDGLRAWPRQVARGHPKEPCPGNHCALRMQTQS